MKPHALVLSCLLAAPLAISVPVLAQNLLSSGDAVGLEALPSSNAAADDNAYADGVRALDSSRWSDAIAIFSKVATEGGAHADAALYWKAYAQNKQWQLAQALDTCAALRREHAGSSWIEDCGALEIEIHSKNGQPVQPNSEQDDNLKLLALASLMQHDEKKGLEEVDAILNSDEASEKLKQGALFIMGQHHTDTVYPQIARLSFVDGDVRIQRGEQNPHRKDVTWEEAASGVPLESGYSIVTGDGRAEIELENASVLYLAPNSVLAINDLSTTAGVPHTEVALLSGTVTLHVQPYVSGETFLLHTPTDNITTRFPAGSNIRVTSYMDGVALSALEGHLLTVSDHERTSTIYVKNGKRILDAGPIHHEDFSSWDHWVADRYAARTAATEAMLKASGLASPVPGLADMQGQGHFFDCEPYGKCWEPDAAAEHIQTTSQQDASGEKSSPIAASVVSGSSPGQAAQITRDIRFVGPPAASGPGPQSAELGSLYPCIPGDVRPTLSRGAQYPDPAWAWTVCHTGGWIYQNNRYLWVAGKRHHRSCVHWVKSGRTAAFVPIHPRDVRDRLPVNRRAPAFAVGPKNEHTLQRVSLNNLHSVELMKEPPREFRNAVPTPLPRVAEPHMEGHQIHDFTIAKGMTPHPGIPIMFDHHSQSFMMPNHAMEANRTSTGFTPISNRGGDLQAHSGVTSGGGFHGGSAGGGFHGGASGGAGHSGGASSGGGGGSHGGGGGGGGVSSAGVSSGGGGGGGGSHH